MSAQSVSAVKTSPRESPCRDIGSTDSDDSQNIDLTPEAIVSHLEHGQDSVSGAVSRKTVGKGARRISTGFSNFSNRLHHKRCLNKMASLRYRTRKIQDVQKAEEEIAMLAMTNASLSVGVAAR
ncbi:hypothetical protein MTO96_021571 [Rhipicephalus appendiculatus]